MSSVIWMYYFQSVFIGIQYFLRLLFIGWRKKNIPVNPDSDKETKDKKSGYSTVGMALFFAFHYGMFHFVYLIFLIGMSSKLPGEVDTRLILYFFAGLLLNLIFSLISDVRKDKKLNTGGGSLFFVPYLRVVPMHLFIIFGFNTALTEKPGGNFFSSVTGVFIFFIILKTLSDLIMHVVVNRTWKAKREGSPL